MKLAYLVVAVLALCSCTDDYVYHDLRDIQDGRWIIGDSLSFTIQPPDTISEYSLLLLMHHSDAYDYQNLYVKTLTVFPDGKEVEGRTSLQLAQPNGGWHGKCSGGSCKVRIELQERLRFDDTGEHVIVFSPYMRMDTVPGIEKIGLALEPWAEAQN